MKNSRLVLFTFLIVAFAAAQANADKTNPSQPAVRESLHQVEARITAIDKKARTISLCCPNGVTTIDVGPEVRNFDAMKVGDKVRASYYEAFTAEIKKKGALAAGGGKSSGDAPATQIASVYRAPEGSRPGAAAGHATQATVRIESVDTKANTVTFKRNEARVTLAIDSPEGQKFIRTLHTGDEVEVTYIEALAIEVVEMK